MLELEQNILECLIEKPDLMQDILITDECFLFAKNRFLFQLFTKQYDENKTIDFIGIVSNYKYLFKSDKQISEMMNYISSELMNQIVTTKKFQYYQECLFKEKTNNEIISKIKLFENNNISQEELLDSIHKIENTTLNSFSKKLTKEEIFKMINSKNKKINFRFNKFNNCVNISEKDFIIIAARPGIGKTGFTLNLMEDLSSEYNCLLFNMEMSEQQCYRRLVGINCNVPITYHDNPETTYQEDVLKKSCENIANKKIQVVSGSQSIKSIKNRIIKESKNEHTIVFIDYVGLIVSLEKTKTIYEKTTNIVKELRQITLDFDCTIFLVAQINRNSEKEKDKRPKISDLKETGELEQSATTVLMLHNENYYKALDMKVEDIELIIGKNRNGKTGIVHLDYNQNTQRFDEPKNNYTNNNDWRKNDKN